MLCCINIETHCCSPQLPIQDLLALIEKPSREARTMLFWTLSCYTSVFTILRQELYNTASAKGASAQSHRLNMISIHTPTRGVTLTNKVSIVFELFQFSHRKGWWRPDWIELLFVFIFQSARRYRTEDQTPLRNSCLR